MKKTLLILSLSVFTCSAFAQAPEQEQEKKQEKKVEEKKDATTFTYVEPAAKISKFHNQSELEKMGKLELTNLYIERVRVLSEILPYIALNKNPAGANLADLGIPETKPNVDDLEKEVKNTTSYVAGIDHTLKDVIPYADKNNIIWSILFMEDTVNKIDNASKGSN